MALDVKAILARNESLGTARSNWNSHWQIVGEYVSLNKQNFEAEHEAGDFLVEDVFDSTAPHAAVSSASALLGMLWPATARKSVVIDPPDEIEDDLTAEEQKWYETATKKLVRAMDDPKANLVLSLDESTLDNVTFGTAGVGTYWEDDGLLYKPHGVKEMRIDEGKNGFVDTVYLNVSWSPRKVVRTYGEENVSKKVREMAADEAKFAKEKVKLVIGYEPRPEKERKGNGALAMAYRSFHIEVETKHVIKESGFEEFPIAVSRLRKLPYEKYGRSFAMNALPDIREINVLREAIIEATEKVLDPALGVMNSGMLGGGTIDTSAGALNVFDMQANAGGSQPVFPINTVGDLNTALARIEDLKESIAQHFSIDRLLDFNNETQMTATEAGIRNNIRRGSLSSLLSRQIAELFTPIVERSFNLMLRNGRFGEIAGTAEAQAEMQINPDNPQIIPERISQLLLDGKDAYQIRYTTPAERILASEELSGLLESTQYIQMVMQSHPEVRAKFDAFKAIDRMQELSGAPDNIIFSDEEADDTLKIEQQQVQKQQQMNQIEQAVGIANEAQNVEG